jgi:hypothetical protein
VSLLNMGQALHSISPSRDFRSTVDASRFTKALYIAATGGVAYNIRNEITETNVQFRTAGRILPVATKTAVTITGFDVVYLY